MKIARVRGIDVYIHWTFWLLIVFYLVSVSQSEGLAGGLVAVAFVFSMFFCVLLHEFGHAFAASWYGIPTADITLLPIGGVARLARIPEKPIQELVVALAGPAVNVAIAIGLLIPIGLGLMATTTAPVVGLGTNFFAQLLIVNVVLVCFNLLPVFPMDGGRVLRSLLAIRLGHLRATQIAARLGRWMALVLAVWAILNLNVLLLLLASFVFIAGTSELIQARMKAVQPGLETRYGRTFVWPSSQPYWKTTQSEEPIQQDPDQIDVIDAIEVRHVR